ncbi:hypothetical protein [Kitasatospora sp. NPDC047058]|uniref:hypothetical protein n=1 Tax=Kitasatospora sp. NPDC047058 TaxID=3155620 RepID=UPI0033C62A49
MHQILYGWAERDSGGNAGVRPIAHSGPATIDRWAERLEHVWATHEAAGENAGDASLAYLVLDGEAAVLRKLPASNILGRPGATLTHVLVGAPELFDARTALGLAAWPGWASALPPAGTRLPVLDGDELQERADDGLARLREAAAALPAAELAALLARVLGEPEADFSVIASGAGRAESARAEASREETGRAEASREERTAAPGDSDGPAPAEPAAGTDAARAEEPKAAAAARAVASSSRALGLMTALVDILGEDPARPWTFASRESTDIGRHQPRVVFLVGPPKRSLYIPDRRRLELGAPVPAAVGAQAELGAFAALLAEFYQRSGWRAVARVRPGAPLRSLSDAEVWRRSVPVRDGRIADPGGLVDPLLDDTALQSLAHEYRGRPSGYPVELVESIAAELRQRPAELLERLLSRWSRTSPRSGRHPQLRSVVEYEAVRAGLTAPLDDDLSGHVRTLVGRVRADGPSPTVVARIVLDLTPHGGLDLERPAHARLLARALVIGVDTRLLTAERALAATSSGRLLRFAVDRARERDPAAARWLLTEVLPDRVDEALAHGGPTQSVHDFRAVQEQLRGGYLLTEEVPRIAGHDRTRQLDCHRELFRAAFGQPLDEDAVVWLLREAGSRSTPAMLAALRSLAREGAAQDRVAREAADRYFREHGLLPAEGWRRPVPARPAGPAPTGGASPAPARAAQAHDPAPAHRHETAHPPGPAHPSHELTSSDSGYLPRPVHPSGPAGHPAPPADPPAGPRPDPYARPSRAERQAERRGAREARKQAKLDARRRSGPFPEHPAGRPAPSAPPLPASPPEAPPSAPPSPEARPDHDHDHHRHHDHHHDHDHDHDRHRGRRGRERRPVSGRARSGALELVGFVLGTVTLAVLLVLLVASLMGRL